jgi:uncharacterized zinc-type alcohol dehydrogenase-like protein
MTPINAWAALGPKEKLVPHKFDPGLLKADEIEVKVEHCGLCHSDVSVINNDWGLSQYPLVPGHEVVGRIVALGNAAKRFEIGERVGIGWNSESDMHCRQCLSGNHHLCPKVVPTIIGHRGGFADRIRAQWEWVLPLPETLDPSAAGPLMCGGITVFAPLVLNNIAPTDQVGVVGIGGLGHMAIKFAKAWGCEVTAFTHSASKLEEARKLGADHVVSHGKPHETKIRRRLSTSLRWPFPADLYLRNVCDLTHKSILPAALFQVIKGIHNCSDPIR